MKDKNLFMPALMLVLLFTPLVSGLIDIRILFLTVLIIALIARGFLGHQEFTSACIDIVFYAAAVVLTFYFVDTSISHGMFPFFDGLSDKAAFTDMLALWVILEAVFHYTYSDNPKINAANITAGIIAELTIAVNGRWGTQFLVFVLILSVAAVIMPMAEHMKRVMQMFFGAAFLLCNMSLLFNYVEWFQVENVTYTLGTSVVGELFLSVLALYVLREWDKIPADVDINRVRLFSFQHRTKQAVKIMLAGAVFFLLIGYDMGIGAHGTNILFLGENGETVETGIFVNTVTALLYHIYEAFQIACSRNVFMAGYAFLGLAGAVVAVLFMGICIYCMYRAYKNGFSGRKDFGAVALLEIIELFFMPVAWELLPLYVLFWYGAVNGNIPTWKTVKSKISKTSS